MSKKRMAVMLFGACRWWKETQVGFAEYGNVFDGYEIDYFYAFWDKAFLPDMEEGIISTYSQDITHEYVRDGFSELYPMQGELYPHDLYNSLSKRREFLKKQVTLMKARKENDEGFLYDVVWYSRTDLLFELESLESADKAIRELSGMNAITFCHPDSAVAVEIYDQAKYRAGDLSFITSSFGAELYGHMFTQFHGKCNDVLRWGYEEHNIDGAFQQYSPLINLAEFANCGCDLLIYNYGNYKADGVVDGSRLRSSSDFHDLKSSGFRFHDLYHKYGVGNYDHGRDKY